MLQADAAFDRAVTDAVTAIEQRTDAEIVVVVTPRSGNYRDVSYAAASLLALAALGGILFSPWAFAPEWIPLELPLLWMACAWWLDQPRILRRLTTQHRRSRHVDDAARAEFVTEALHGTPHRTGVLVYLSLLEREIRVIPDFGAEGRIPPAELDAVRAGWSCASVPAFVDGLTRLGEVLERKVPHLPASNDFDLTNAPRIRR